jgi:hypothetical protein
LPAAIKQRSNPVGRMHFIYQLASGVGWVWVNLLRPVLRPASRGLMAVIRGYRRLWDRHTRGRDGRFSTTRAGVVLTATAVFLFILPGLLGFGLDLALFAATVSQETVWLTQSQEIYPEDDVHSVKGCESRECSPESTIYFRIQPSLLNHLWSLIERGDLFYPDYIAAAVPPGLSECSIIRYGVRIKPLMRRFDLYQQILDARCALVQAQQKP